MDDKLYSVEETDHLWISMSDGTRLAARLWRPDTDPPVPAILEYIPYRKTDMVRGRDERNHPFLAAHGFACIRVDMRGSGDSEGDMPDMYAPAELDDACQIIDWLARQPWCNGRVGMFGTSWGGTASLQASVDAPKALKAVIAVCATHDRFEDDIHYMGGSVLTDTFEWGATLPAILASPPTPHVGLNWRVHWRARIENLTCPLENWLKERGRGAYWRHGSVIHQADRLSVPILAVGGWSDRYSNAVMRLIDARPDLVWGVVGPWGHHYPDHGAPGPAMGFQRLALEWWRHHLAPEGKRPLNWPRLRSWLREFDRPSETLAERAGGWIESGAPSEEVDPHVLSLDDLAGSSAPAPWTIPPDPRVGMASGDTGYFGRAGGLPLDPTPDDARSLVFETTAHERDIVIYGAPVLALHGVAQSAAGQVVARLSDVAPDGTACRISYGVRNLRLDDRLDEPAGARLDRRFDISIPLHTTAYRLRRGHRLRIALSSSLWPLIWSDNASGDMEIHGGQLCLPRLRGNPNPLHTPLPAAEDLPVEKSFTTLAAPELKRWTETTGTTSEIGWHQQETRVHYHQTDTQFGYETRMVHRLDTQGRLHQSTEVQHRFEYQRPDGTATVTTGLTAESDGDRPKVRLTLDARWNNKSMGQRMWEID